MARWAIEWLSPWFRGSLWLPKAQFVHRPAKVCSNVHDGPLAATGKSTGPGLMFLRTRWYVLVLRARPSSRTSLPEATTYSCKIYPKLR